MKKPKGFFVDFHHSNVIGLLSNEQAGRLIKALMDYGENGELSDFSDDGMLNVTYTLLRDEIDLNFEKYNAMCERRKEIAVQRENAKKEVSKKQNSSHQRFDDSLTREEIDDIEETIRRKNAHIYED